MVSLIKRKKEIIILFLIILLATFLRLYQIDQRAVFLGDEGRDALVVKRMIVDHKWTLLGPSTSIGDMYLGPIYYYMMIPPLWLARLDPVGPAIMVALIGVATVYLVFVVGREFFGMQAGMLAAGLYAVSQVVIRHTRFSWNPNPVPFFALLAIWSLFKIFNKRGTGWFFLMGLCLGVCLQLHYLTAILAGFCVITLFVFKSRWKWKQFLVFSLSFLLVFSPLILFEFRHGFIVSKSLWRFLTKDNKFGISLLVSLVRSAGIYKRLFEKLIGLEKPVVGIFLAILSLPGIIFSFIPLRQKTPPLAAGMNGEVDPAKLDKQSGVCFRGMKPFGGKIPCMKRSGGQGIFMKVKKERKSALKLVLFLMLFGCLAAGFYKETVHDHYLGFLFPAPFLLAGLFLDRLISGKSWRKILGWIIFALLFVFNLSRTDGFSTRGNNNQIIRAKIIGKMIAEDAKGTTFNISLISPTNDFRAMNYRYFAEIYGAQPQEFDNYDKIDTLYVITEHDKAVPTDMVSWEIASFGKAKAVEEWRLDFGFLVQKLKKAT